MRPRWARWLARWMDGCSGTRRPRHRRRRSRRSATTCRSTGCCRPSSRTARPSWAWTLRS
eukprot:4798490-Prymnesium_polylepis.1